MYYNELTPAGGKHARLTPCLTGAIVLPREKRLRMTLDELRAQNAKPTEEVTEETVPDVIDEVEDAADDADDLAEGEGNEEVEGWLVEDSEGDETAGDDRKFTDSDIGAAKRNMRAKLEKKHNSEMDDLKAEIEALKLGSNNSTATTGAGVKPRPRLEDFDYDDGQFNSAMDEWYDDKINSRISTASQTQAHEAQAKRASEAMNLAVDGHYERAAKLAEASGISPDVYKNADLSVRQAIEGVMPNMGDVITDNLISRLGEGSEKTMYLLGRNKSELAKFTNILANDPTGIDAAIHLGKLQASKTQPVKRKTKAPAPARSVQGDSSTGNASGKHAKAYESAHKKGDMQAAFNARREAKKAGVDVSKW